MDGLAIAASLAELRPMIEGGLVRSIHEPVPSLFVIGVFANGNQAVLVSPQQALLQRTLLRLPNPQAPGSFVMLLRKHLRGGKVRAVRQPGWERVVVFEVERFDGVRVRAYQLVAELTGIQGSLVLVEDDRVLGSERKNFRLAPGAPYAPPEPQAKLDPAAVTADALRDILHGPNVEQALVKAVDGVGRATAEDVAAFARAADMGSDLAAEVADALRAIAAYARHPAPHVEADGARVTFYPPPYPAAAAASFGEALDLAVNAAQDRQAQGALDRTLRTRVQYALGRRARTAAKLRAWLAVADRAADLRRQADLLSLHVADLGPGTREAIIPDPLSGQPVSLVLDPALGARENIRRLYKQARRLVRGRPTVTSRLARLEGEIRTLEDALSAIDRGDEAAAEALVLLDTGRKRPLRQEPRSAPRQFEIEGYAVWVGRSAAQNDQLLRDAHPEDAWLHARDVAGSHVIVRRGDARDIPDSVLRAAARLAARHSKAERGRNVQVTLAKVKHVRKPKNAPPGLAIVDHESTLTVRLEENE
jgi:predicted ribosome quality control (RQC) complex YloA/Tae2 family protein